MFKPGWPARLVVSILVLVAWIFLMVWAVENISQAFYGVDFPARDSSPTWRQLPGRVPEVPGLQPAEASASP